MAELAPANGTWPMRMVCMPITNVCAKAPMMSHVLAARLTLKLRRANCMA